MKGKNIVRLTAAVMLIIMIITSLSSCVLDFEFYSDLFDYLENQQNGGGENNGDNNQNGDNGDSGNNIPNLGGSVGSDNYGDFYPGSGNESLENLSPKVRSLLSTVTIISSFAGSVGAGSGVIYKVDKNTGDAYVITNYHVVYSANYGVADSIKLYLYGMHLESYAVKATLLGGSVTYDIAVLKVKGSEVIKNSYATEAAIGSSENVRVFDRVYTVGNSEGMGISATEGIVSVESENLDINGADGSLVSLRVMRVDAAINHGNSGGGIYDEEGRLVGIAVAKETGADIDNMGYAIPADLAIKVANNVIDTCDGLKVKKVQKALMGITITSYVSGLQLTPDGSHVYEVNLVEVVEISKGSLADGKIKVGDIINSITVDGKTTSVCRVHHVTDAMLDARLGSTVVLNINRGGEKLNVTFTVGQSDITTVN